MTRRYEILPLLVEAIAEADDSPVHDLGYSLNDHIEIEAINALATSDHTGWEISFQVPDHTVTIRDGEQILVDGDVIRKLDTSSDQEKPQNQRR